MEVDGALVWKTFAQQVNEINCNQQLFFCAPIVTSGLGFGERRIFWWEISLGKLDVSVGRGWISDFRVVATRICVFLVEFYRRKTRRCFAVGPSPTVGAL